MPDRLLAAMLLLTTEIAERFLGRLLVDAAALYVAKRDNSKVESWLHRQSLDS
jgi:hypothetical protein